MDDKDMIIAQYMKQNENLAELVKTLTASNENHNEIVKELQQQLNRRRPWNNRV